VRAPEVCTPAAHARAAAQVCTAAAAEVCAAATAEVRTAAAPATSSAPAASSRRGIGSARQSNRQNNNAADFQL
jgi:hypothetical protein